MANQPRRRSAIQQFGERVRRLRLQRGLSQIALGERAGVHFTFISAVERGKRSIRLENLLRLARALGVDPADLVRGLRPD